MIYNGASQILTVNLVVDAISDRGLSAGPFGLALSASGAGTLGLAASAVPMLTRRIRTLNRPHDAKPDALKPAHRPQRPEPAATSR